MYVGASGEDKQHGQMVCVEDTTVLLLVCVCVRAEKIQEEESREWGRRQRWKLIGG